MIVAIIITATLCLASCQPPEGYYPGTQIVAAESDQCYVVSPASSGYAVDTSIVDICFPGSVNGSTFLPTKLRPDHKLGDLKREFSDWTTLLDLSYRFPQCIDTLRLFVCYSYFPLCYSLQNGDIFVVYPCKELCELVTPECKAIVEDLGSPWPEWIENYNCSSLRSACAGHSDCVPHPLGECPTTPPAATTASTTSRPSCDQNGDSNETQDECDPEDSATNSTIRVITPTAPSCISFQNDICSSSFNYNSTSPSSFRSNDLTNSSDYNREFADFYSIIKKDTPCSAYIKTFFCFTYFPYCQTVNGTPKLIYPCSEVCESILGNGTCREELLDLGYRVTGVRQLPRWLQSYDCNTLESISSGRCAGGPDPPTEPPITTEPTSITTEPTTEPPCTCSDCAAPCLDISCKYRIRASGGTFKNNDYSFAARVVFLGLNGGIDCKSYYVRVVHQYRVESVTDGTLAPDMGSYTDIWTNIPIGCDNCDFGITYGRDDNDSDPENSYFIAGYYSHNECNDPCFKLLSHNSLITDWQSKFNTRMDRWVRDGNTYRTGLRRN